MHLLISALWMDAAFKVLASVPCICMFNAGPMHKLMERTQQTECIWYTESTARPGRRTTITT